MTIGNPRAHIVVGLGFGDEGKGSMVDYLTRKHGASLVVKFNGGSQCGHNVVLSDGTHHCFSQFGSGTFAGARTHLSRHVSIDPHAMYKEAGTLEAKIDQEPLSLITIDPLCPVITPYHVMLNKMRERMRGADRHGSCGMGVGEVRHFMEKGYPVLRAFELRDSQRTTTKLRQIKAVAFREIEKGSIEDREWMDAERPESVAGFYHDMAKELSLVTDEEIRAELPRQATIFEGGQGVLLDEQYGFAPYNTWSRTTPDNARIFINGTVATTIIGVVRTYMTRHGPGPFVTEDHTMSPSCREHNASNEWQGRFRLGLMDFVALRYALAVAQPIDEVAVTHADELKKQQTFRYCDAYNLSGTHEDITPEWSAARLFDCTPRVEENFAVNFPEVFQQQTKQHVKYLSFGPTAEDKQCISTCS